MLEFNPLKSGCTGCAACYSVCPVRCISMCADEEGFLYPEASDACIGCGKCEEVCPNDKPNPYGENGKKVLAAVSKDKNIWRRSASGGAFSEIVRHWADDETLIVGAVWDGFRVHHLGVMGFNAIAPLCKSKYLSSAIEDTFLEISRHLKAGGRAIFCGCPCQVDGLRRYIGKDNDSLLCIDMICHGQGSPYVFEECMKYVGEVLGENVKEYGFRAKRRNHEKDYMSKIVTGRRTLYVVNDPYVQLFLSQNALRPSCAENCRYRDVRRPGDLTIADFKGLAKVFPELTGTKRNYSTIVSNTPKGERILESLGDTMEVKECDVESVIRYNALFGRQAPGSEGRDVFFSDFRKDPREAIVTWTSHMLLRRYSLKQRIKDVVPSAVIRILYEIKEYFR